MEGKKEGKEETIWSDEVRWGWGVGPVNPPVSRRRRRSDPSDWRSWRRFYRAGISTRDARQQSEVLPWIIKQQQNVENRGKSSSSQFSCRTQNFLNKNVPGKHEHLKTAIVVTIFTISWKWTAIKRHSKLISRQYWKTVTWKMCVKWKSYYDFIKRKNRKQTKVPIEKLSNKKTILI